MTQVGEENDGLLSWDPTEASVGAAQIQVHRMRTLGDEGDIGFVGREDVASGYYCTRPSGVAAHVGDRDLKSKVKLSGIGLDSKSAVAM